MKPIRVPPAPRGTAKQLLKRLEAREVEAIVATRERIARGAGGTWVDCGEPRYR